MGARADKYKLGSGPGPRAKQRAGDLEMQTPMLELMNLHTVAFRQYDKKNNLFSYLYLLYVKCSKLYIISANDNAQRQFVYFIVSICRNTLKRLFESVSIKKSNLKFRKVASNKDSH